MHVDAEISALLQRLNNPSLPGIDLSLERMWQLLAALGNPQDALPPVIHIAGTNGKGSTLAFLRAIYEAAGYRVHAYTSPHLVRFNERMLIVGEEITDEALLPLLHEVEQAARDIPVTFFEATTAAALVAFSRTPADVVLLETGLGGRLDATNVVAHPALTILTPISFDHMEFLGDSIAAIAGEKAGILKSGAPCVVGEQLPEAMGAIRARAETLNAPLRLLADEIAYESMLEGMRVRYPGGEILTPTPALLGGHQYHNAALAILAAQVLREKLPVTTEALATGIGQACWPARLQKLRYGSLVDAWQGDVHLDGAHNRSGAEMLATWARAQHAPVTLVCGMMRRKSIRDFLEPLSLHVDRVIAVPIEGEDCHPPSDIAQAARSLAISEVEEAYSIAEAAKQLQCATSKPLLVAGSLFLAGIVLKNHR